MDEQEKYAIIARPTEAGTFNKRYFYRGEEFADFKAALKARAEALDKAGIESVTEREIAQAENAIERSSGSKKFLGRMDLCTKSESEGDSGVNLDSIGSGESTLTLERSAGPIDGIARMINVFAWLTLVVGVIAGLALLSAGVIGLVFIAAGLFQFAILSGFSRIIEYLRQIAQSK